MQGSRKERIGSQTPYELYKCNDTVKKILSKKKNVLWHMDLLTHKLL